MRQAHEELLTILNYELLTEIHLDTLTNIFPWFGKIVYKNFPAMKNKTAAIIRIAGTPKASGKQSSIPKHWTSSLKIGVIDVDSNEPALIEK